MKPNKRIIFIAIVLGLVTVLTLHFYLNQSSPEASATFGRSDVPHTSIVVADMTIPQHTRITSEMLTMSSIPTDTVHPEALKNTADVVGGISRSDIVRGEQVLSSRVATEEMRASLSYRIPENMRGISIPIGEIGGVSGFISPGDRVDVLITYNIFLNEDEEDEEEYADTKTTYTVIQNALVLAAGGTTRERDNEERELVGTMTLAVTPAQAEVLAYAVGDGSFHLTLRSPLDEDIIELDHYNIDNFDTFRER